MLLKKKVFLLCTINSLFSFSLFLIFYFLLDLKTNMELAISLMFLLTVLSQLISFMIIDKQFISKLNHSITFLKKIAERDVSAHPSTFLQKDNPSSVTEFADLQSYVVSIHEHYIQTNANQQKRDGEIEEIEKKLKVMLKESEEVVRELKENVTIVKQNTDNQINNIRNSENAMQEMIEGIFVINKAVTDLSNNTKLAVETANNGNKNLEKVVVNMNRIQQNAEESVYIIDDLGEHIKDIQTIVDGIEAISSRTNLLALNATIEAERAGDNSDGFAVVSEEIKELAVRASQSTEEIEKRARIIIEKKDLAIKQIEKNRSEVQNGIKSVNEISKSFNTILSSTHNINEKLQDVTTSSEQLKQGTQRIIKDINFSTNYSADFLEKIQSLENSLEQTELNTQTIKDILKNIRQNVTEANKLTAQLIQ